MKTLILALAILTGGTVMAQQQEKREHQTAEQRATSMTERMSTQLSLDDAQKAKIQEINLGVVKKNEAIRENTSLTHEQKFAQMKENHTACAAQYKTVLTSDQYIKYQAWEKEKQEKMQAKHAEKQGEQGGRVQKGTKAAPSSK
ncbi:hypothetical protein [Fluviicola sp.]|uniref:hypothetical protein n=1 Tax=Fluviicola sp. TaxID=1917219 RepID=UPI00281EEDE0|nr:hypothetical protein [Fluviicola sp.]MDR0802476.1 DUF4890 domain-containing protein [Fluviicola sp.]